MNHPPAPAVTPDMDWHTFRLAPGTEDPQPRAPWESFLLAYAGVTPLALGAIATPVLPAPAAALALHMATTWAGALLCFFSGVHRGLSFRQAGGPRLSQLGSMLWLFLTGVVSLLSPWPGPALVLQLAGFASMAVLDPVAARHGEAPRYFARLRPVQLTIPLASLAALLWQALRN